MRRKVIIKKVKIDVSENFYNLLEKQRRITEQKLGITKQITQPRLTELLIRSGLKFPKINFNLFENVKRKKR